MASHGSGRPSGPNEHKERRKNDVLNEMLDLFLASVEVEVIQSVLECCDYDYEKSKEALNLMSENTQDETPVQPAPQSPFHLRHPEHQRIQHANPKPSVPMTQSAPQQSSSGILQSPRKVNPTDQALERINQYIKDGNKILVLMRGCPGSGKTFLATQLVQLCGGERSNHHFSSDDYFLRTGKYIFNPQELQSAHKSTQDDVLRAVRNGYSPVIVDNTNTQSWEMQVYVIMAVNHGYAVETLEPQTPWKFNHAQLVKRNTHNVPAENIRCMLGRYEHGLTGEDIIKQLKLNYPPSKYPPQPARKTSNRNSEPVASPSRQLRSPALFSSPKNVPSGRPEAFIPQLRQITSQQPQPINTDDVRAQNPLAGLLLEQKPCEVVSKIPETVSALPSTSKPQSPLPLWSELPSSDSPCEERIVLPWENPNCQTFVSPVTPVSQSSFQSSQFNQQLNPETCEFHPGHSINTVASQLSNDNNVVVTQSETGDLINLDSPSPDEAKSDEFHITLDTTNMAKKFIFGKEDSETLEWGASNWEAFLSETFKRKSDNECSTDQRQRWSSSNSGDTNINKDEKQAECASGTVAQNAPDWGFQENAYTWDLSLEGQVKGPKIDLSQRKHFASSSKQESGTNTNCQDFLLISNNIPPAQLPSGVRLLTAYSRDINANLVNYVPPIPKKIVVDVSSMTEDECGDPVKGSLQELQLLFPHVSIGNLETLLETCHDDVNWASNCLLDTDSGVRLDIAALPIIGNPSSEVQSSEVLPPPVDDTPPPKPVELHSNNVIDIESKTDMTQSTSLVRSLSQNLVHSESGKNVGLIRSSSLPMIPQNSDPQTYIPDTVTPLKMNPETPPKTDSITSPTETFKKKSSLYPDLPNESEIEVLLPEGSDESETYSQDDEEMLEFVISSEFSQQLFNRFGGPHNKFPKSGLSPVLRIPESIAHQIHYYLVLSQQEYYAEEDNAGEEEEFAAETQEIIDQHIYEEMCAQRPLTEQEQEDMELATAIYELDLAAVYNTKDTVAAVLARKLLQETFPTLDRNLLDELLEIHGNSFHKTKEMIQEHYMNNYTVKQKDFPALNKSQTKTSARNRSDVSDKVRLRADADGELQIARIYKQKAKEQSARREWSAAAVYSQMAKVHKRQHNRNMELTVQRVLADNMKSYCPSSLDLHFLPVEEALIKLDDFLDRHILSFADQPNKVKSLYIITGRGKHSSGGIPKIRPAVLERLDERLIESTLENPGLVRADVTGRSQLSYEC